MEELTSRPRICLNAYRDPGDLFDEFIHDLNKINPKINKSKYKRVMGMVLGNLSSTCWKSYSRSHTLKCKRYNKWKITPHMINLVVDWMEQKNHIRLVIGVQGKHYSLIQAYPGTSLLNGKRKYQDEYIILRDKDKKLIDYKDTTYTNMARLITSAYNEVLDDHVFTLDGRTYRPQYYRIYNNDFEKGGRYYKADILNIPSDDRYRLCIDGEKTVEIDFKSFQAAYLYGKVGQPLPEYPYGFLSDRVTAKKVLSIALNTSSKKAATAALRSLWEDDRLEGSEKGVLDALESHLSAIKQFFYTDIGFEVMNRESEIATGVVSVFTKFKKPLLVIHDGFIVQEQDELLLMECMLDAYSDVFEERQGVLCPVSITRPTTYQDIVMERVWEEEDLKSSHQFLPRYTDTGRRVYLQEVKEMENEVYML